MLKLSLPAFMGMFIMSLYNVVDTIFIGRYVGSLGIAGLSLVFPVQMLAMGIGQITGMGGASVISRLIGAAHITRAEKTLGNATTITLVMSVIVIAIGLARTDVWLSLLGASEAVLPYAHDYMVIILIGMFFQTLAMAYSSLIRAEGNAQVPMIGMIIGAVLNIILDWVFIIPLGMGVAGAAWATVIAQIVSVIYFLFYYFSGKSFLKYHPKDLILIDWGILKDIMAIGMSAFAMTVAGSISGALMNRVIVSYGGDMALSTFGVVNRILMFALMPAMVIGQGLQPILGFNYGAGRFDRALKSIKISVVWATVLCSVSFIVLFFFPEPLLRIFSTESELIAMGTEASKIIFFVVFLVGFIMVGSTVFMAVGKPVQAFLSSIARPAMFLIPMIYILPYFWGLNGVWMAFPFADALTFILVGILLIPEIRRFRQLEAASGDKARFTELDKYPPPV